MSRIPIYYYLCESSEPAEQQAFLTPPVLLLLLLLLLLPRTLLLVLLLLLLLVVIVVLVVVVSMHGPGELSRYSDSLRAGRSGVRIPLEASFSAPVHTGPWTHPASFNLLAPEFYI
jgi:hypothetical protein